MRKLIISAALTGTHGSKKNSPFVPLSAAEIAADAVACAKAGAAVIHIHVHDEMGKPTMETGYFVEAFEATREATKAAGVDPIINLTTSGGSSDTELRLAHLKKLQPEMCSYDSGSFNWNMGGIFQNSPDFLKKCGLLAQELDIKPEIEIFDTGMLGNALDLIRQGVLRQPCHFQFVLGVLGGMDASIDNLEHLHRRLPENCTWSVTGIGKGHLPMLLAGLAMGADGIRVGLEDNLYLDKGVKATNAQLVERAVEIAQLANREIATADEARAILGITRHAMR